MARADKKTTQRNRLIGGMIEAVNRGGYANATVSAVIARARVSRPTFYEYFADRDDCFLACVDDVAEELGEMIVAALAGQPPERSTAAVVQTLVTFASTHRARAQFLMGGTLGAGEQRLEHRDRVIAGLAKTIEQAEDGLHADALVADLDPHVMVGGVWRTLTSHLRRGQPTISNLQDELLEWLARFERPFAEHRWRAPVPTRTPMRSEYVPELPIRQMPNALPPGRTHLSSEQIAENHRLRILYATARLAEEKGYLASTVNDITQLAKVDPHAFYRLFADKQDAFMSLHELGFQQLMDVTSKAFLSRQHWPERSWEAGRAFTHMLQENPRVAHVGFVEAYAVGPAAIQRIEDSHVAFMFFLQEGSIYRPDSEPPTRTAMETTINCIFEIIYQQARNPGTPQVAAKLPHIAHLWLTPFLGPEASGEFIEQQLNSETQDRKSRPRNR